MSDLSEQNHFSLALSDACLGYAALKPPNRVTVAQGAKDTLIVKQPGTAAGPWSPDETPYMVEPMNALASRRHEAVVFVGPARTGKCLDIETPILTTTGWSKMGDLVAGDRVFGPDGKPTKVLAAHPVLHNLVCYEVRFSDGSSIVADADHLWGVERFYWKEPNWRYEVRTTTELLADLMYGGNRFRYRIANTTPLETPEAPLLVDPYVLGLWLGNGILATGTIVSHEDDVPHVEAAIRNTGWECRSKRNKVGSKAWETRTSQCDLFGNFTGHLRLIGVLNNKHIPEKYLRASASQRLALLRGLMDSDGHANPKANNCEFSTVRSDLAENFCELARTLGFKPILKAKSTTWVHNGERRNGSAYRVTFPVHADGPNPFSLPRKRDVISGSAVDVVKYRQIVAIEPVTSRPVRCIAVDNESRLFLAGKGLVATHNTAGLLLGWMAHNIVNDPGDMLFLQMTKDTARTFSKTDVDRALRNSPKLHAMKSTRAIDSNTFDTMFAHGMFLRIAWPTITNVSGSTYRYVAITDIDRMENAENVDGEGPLFDLAKKRTQTFLSRGMTLVESSPGKLIEDPNFTPVTPHEAPPVGGILSLYNRTDRRRWYWKCPDCSVRFEASPGLDLFGLPDEQQLLDEVRSLNIPAFAKDYARVICPCCGSLIEPKWKKMLNEGGIWVPDNVLRDDKGCFEGEPQFNQHGEMQSTLCGYWLGGVAAFSQQWHSIVENHLNGLREFALTGSEEKLKQTTNTDQGAPYMSRHLRSANAASRPEDRTNSDLRRFMVPDDTRCLVASVDVQGGTNARFEIEVHAVGVEREQWLVDRFSIKDSARPGIGTEFAPIDPARYPEDWDVLTERLLRATWRTSDEDRELRLKMLVVDTGGEDGVTDNAYAWYRRLRQQRLHNRVTLYKGASTPNAPVIRESMVGKHTAKSKGDIPLLVCNPNLLSDIVSAGLKRGGPGPGYIHFPPPKHPVTNPNGWLPAAFFDELSAEVRQPNGTWAKVRARNESFDLCRMICAGLLRLGLDKIRDWNKVPPWLAPLHLNSEIVSRSDRRAMQENKPVAPTAPAEVRVLRRVSRPRRRSVAAL